MRKHMAVLVIGISIGAWAAPALANPETISGDVVSLSCYFNDKRNIGKAGLLCAMATVKYEGNPVGIVTSNGKVYQLAGDLVANHNAKAVPLLGHKVTVTGEVTEKAGVMVITAGDAKVAD